MFANFLQFLDRFFKFALLVDVVQRFDRQLFFGFFLFRKFVELQTRKMYEEIDVNLFPLLFNTFLQIVEFRFYANILCGENRQDWENVCGKRKLSAYFSESKSILASQAKWRRWLEPTKIEGNRMF